MYFCCRGPTAAKFFLHSCTIYAIYMVGGLLIAATVDLAVRTAHNPDNLLRLSHTLINLVGNRCQKYVVRKSFKSSSNKNLHA